MLEEKKKKERQYGTIARWNSGDKNDQFQTYMIFIELVETTITVPTLISYTL